MRAQFQFTFLFLAIIPLLAAAGSQQGASLGGWKTLINLKDPYVKEIASFAVTEYNKAEKASLTLTGVKNGEYQVVDGVKYRLIISAVDGKATHDYKTIVWDKPRTHERQLVSFTPVKN